MPPKTPTRSDAYVACACGGTMGIVTVEPISYKPDFMRHTYRCADCGKDAKFDVAKKALPPIAEPRAAGAKKPRG